MQANTKQHPEAEHQYPHSYSKIIGHILKINQKNKCVCIHEIIRLIIMKMKMKMKNTLQRYDINRPRSRHGHKYSNYKKFFSICIIIIIYYYRYIICMKQQLQNI